MPDASVAAKESNRSAPRRTVERGAITFVVRPRVQGAEVRAARPARGASYRRADAALRYRGRLDDETETPFSEPSIFDDELQAGFGERRFCALCPEHLDVEGTELMLLDARGPGSAAAGAAYQAS